MLRLLLKFIISNFILVIFSINTIALSQDFLLVKANGAEGSGTNGKKNTSHDNKNMKILFLSKRDKSTVQKAETTMRGNLYKKDLDTGIETCILDNEISPKVYGWSPDGKQVVFAGKIDWKTKLYLINEDGSDLKELFSFGDRRVTINGLTWGWEGYIAVSFSASTGNVDTGDLKSEVGLIILNLDGKVLTKLDRWYCNNLRWLENGKKLAFISHEEDSKGESIQILCTMTYNGEDKKEVVLGNPKEVEYLSILDGKKIAFIFGLKNMERDIKVIDMERGAKVLTSTNQHDKRQLIWSPSGKKISYIVTDPTGIGFLLGINDEIWIVDIEEDRAKKVFRGGSNEYITWSNDERYLIFSSQEDSKSQIYSVDINTSEVKQLTHIGINWGPVLFSKSN